MGRDPAFEEVSDEFLAKGHWRVVIGDSWLFVEIIAYLEAQALVKAVTRVAASSWGRDARASPGRQPVGDPGFRAVAVPGLQASDFDP